MNRTHTAVPRALGERDVEVLREQLLGSPFVGRSPLAGTFKASRGFAMAFRRDGLSLMYKRFSPLSAFTDLALSDEARYALLDWPGRLAWKTLGRKPQAPNAFYLNLLIVGNGASVGSHVDATLREHCGDDTVLPYMVSVLYLHAPPSLKGGELILSDQGKELARIFPRTGDMLHFRGDLAHAIAPVTHREGEQPRMSLVCEQYVLPSEAYGQTPMFKLHSKAGFAAFLEDQRTRPPRQFDLD